MGEWIRHSCCNFFFSHGFTITKVMLVLTMLIKVNVYSLVYLMYFFRLYKSDFYPSRFELKQKQPETIANREKAARALNGLILWTSLFILADYLFFVFFSF